MSTTMSDLNNRVARLEGRSSSTPITMSDLKSRIEALEARPVKDWVILSLVHQSGYDEKTYGDIPSEYLSYNHIVVYVQERYTKFDLRNDRGNYQQISNGVTSRKSGNKIIMNSSSQDPGNTIQVLFYK